MGLFSGLFHNSDEAAPAPAATSVLAPCDGVWESIEKVPDDTFAEFVLHAQELGGLALEHAARGNSGPRGDDVGDIVRVRGQRLGLDLVTRLTGLTYTSGAPTMGVTLADRRML